MTLTFSTYRKNRLTRCRWFCAAGAALLLSATPTWGQFGANITPPQPLNTNAATDLGFASDEAPVVATDGAGLWIAVWYSRTDVDLGGGMTAGTDADIFYSRSTDNGATWSALMPLNTNAASDSRNDEVPDIATDGQGNWLVVWASEEDFPLGGGLSAGTDQDIFYARSSDNGLTWSDPAPVNSNVAGMGGSDRRPKIATDRQGTWMVVWESDDPNVAGGIGMDRDILFARSTDNGAAWTPAAPVNSNAAGDTGGDFIPSIATDGQGIWIVTWESSESFGGTIGTDRDILFSRSTDAGATWTVPAPANSNAGADAGDDEESVIVTDGQGTWMVVWWSYDTLDPADPVTGLIGTDQDLLFVRSMDNGMTWSYPAPLNNNAATDTGYEESPSLATDGQGNWVVVWYSNENLNGAIGTDTDILIARSADNGLIWTDPVPLNTNADTDTGGDFSPSIATDGLGNWVVAWTSSDTLGMTIGTDSDILVARFALPDCNLNGIGDGQDIAGGTSEDCDHNGVPDECQPDSNGDGIIDACELPAPEPSCCAPGVFPTVGLFMPMVLVGWKLRRSRGCVGSKP